MKVYVVTAYTGTKRITLKEKRLAETKEEADQIFAMLAAKYEGTKVKVDMYETEAEPTKEEPVKEPPVKEPPVKEEKPKKKSAPTKKKPVTKKKSTTKSTTRKKKA